MTRLQINYQVDVPAGTLPLGKDVVKSAEGKNKLDVPLSDDVTPTWRELEKVRNPWHRCHRLTI